MKTEKTFEEWKKEFAPTDDSYIYWLNTNYNMGNPVNDINDIPNNMIHKMCDEILLEIYNRDNN